MKLGYENNHNIPCEENISIWKFEPWEKNMEIKSVALC